MLTDDHSIQPPPGLKESLDGEAKKLPIFNVNQDQVNFLSILWNVLKISPFKLEQLKPCPGVDGLHVPSNSVTHVLLLPDLQSMDIEVITSQVDELIFERLMMDATSISDAQNLIALPIIKPFAPLGTADDAKDGNQFKYLFECYHRLLAIKNQTIDHQTKNEQLKEGIDLIEKSIFNQASIFLSQPDIYPMNKIGSEAQSSKYEPNTRIIIKLIDSHVNSFEHRNSLPLFLESLTASLYQKYQNESAVHPINIFDVHLLNALSDRLDKCRLISQELINAIEIIKLITSGKYLCKLFMDANCPWIASTVKPGARSYIFKLGSRSLGFPDDIQRTIIGRLLSISCLTSPSNPSFDFYSSPSRTSQAEFASTDRNVGAQVKMIANFVHELFLKLLKNDETKSNLLNWIGLTLTIDGGFKDRAKMWTNMASTTSVLPSDGFCLNLSYVLLLLCKPFSEPYSAKLLKIDPRYVRGAPLEVVSRSLSASEVKGHIFMRGMDTETMITSDETDATSLEAASAAPGHGSDGTINKEMAAVESVTFNFMTEIFFMAHKSIEIGFKSCNERFLNLTRELNQLSRAVQDANNQAGSAQMLERINQEFEKQSIIYFSLRSMLINEELIDLMIKFTVSTATWINNLAASADYEDFSHGFKKITNEIINEEDARVDLASAKLGVENLKLIPEFIVDNITTLIIFTSRFLERLNLSFICDIEPLMTLVLMFMGSVRRTKNPHLRASFAEILQLLIPDSGNASTSYSLSGRKFNPNFASGFNNFTSHPNASELVPALLRSFVSIEKTDHFEQKFQYRQPMYAVLKYLWMQVKVPHRERMKKLASDAERDIDAASAPLFLRFINLLINDANHLLAEALDYMKKLKTLQFERDSGSWNKLNPLQRRDAERNYEHQGRLAQFHNVMSRDTIETLSWLTSEVRSIFYHPTLAPRMAQMLNYFLKFLVGPSSKEFKVKDMKKEYSFQPANIVHDICLIYVHLCSVQDADDSHGKDMDTNFSVSNLGVDHDFEDEKEIHANFCKEIAADSRSYSSGLLAEAGNVLLKTGMSEDGLGLKMQSLSRFVDKLGVESAASEINVDDVPDEFLDPIMSTLMMDPVKLPSGYILDRSTIARHLLSDQNDPFTRQSLSMEMVIPEPELKARIESFIEEYNRKRKDAHGNNI